MAIECPTPQKGRYATREVASQAATRYGFMYETTLRSYECACTWYHLTTGAAPDPLDMDAADQAHIQYVAALPDAPLREIVEQDARGIARPADAAALRNEMNLTRWKEMIGQLLNQVETRISARRKDPSLEAHDWRKRALVYRNVLIQRKNECKQLRAEAHADMIRKHDSRLREAKRLKVTGADIKVLRGQAGEVAIDRLINAHGVEFSNYLADAYKELGLELPDRVKRHLDLPDSEETADYMKDDDIHGLPGFPRRESAEPAPGSGGYVAQSDRVADDAGVRDGTDPV